MRRGIIAERRLAPEAASFEERMDAILLKYANVPLGTAGHLPLPAYYNVMDVAADSVEQAAYPGTDDARKRYALALRRCARELRDVIVSSDKEIGRALWRARTTLQLALEDGTLGLWKSPQALVDEVGRQADGEAQAWSKVSSEAWGFVWDYAVASRLRQVCPEPFASVADNRPFMSDKDGRLLSEEGKPLRWIWDGEGSGCLEDDAAVNQEGERALLAAIDETRVAVVAEEQKWADAYKTSPEHRAFRQRQVSLFEGTRALMCEVLAGLLDRSIVARVPAYVEPIDWAGVTDDEFERRIFSLVRSAEGYSSVAWLTHTRAPDRGRDMTAVKTVVDSLGSVRHLNVVIQCKHWRSRSVSLSDVSSLISQMVLAPNTVDELIIATSGWFTNDAVEFVEKRNAGRSMPRVEMWPCSHLEYLLSNLSGRTFH